MVWVTRLLCPLSALLALDAGLAGHPWRAAALLLASAFWARAAVASPHRQVELPGVDEQWAREVLAAAGHPRDVAAVKALRDAEPRLGLLAAKELADRVRG